jgi:hypothetical protein
MAVNYQSFNILNDFYNMNGFNYILASTFIANPNYFLEIVNYCKTSIPEWYPVLNDSRNRLAFNSSAMFEIIFHKNIIVVIPLYIPNYGIYESNLLKIKEWCEHFITAENNKNSKLLALLDYKLIIYTPTHYLINFKVDITKTNTTILGTPLYMTMYETLPQKLNYLNNPLYMAYNTTSTPTTKPIEPMQT